ncbi:methyl-accepting chemotaxis protein [Ensifer soli]|uniref:methyl-accepting chemotaxis protein n=1 Tax=Ciceribacter sp. sgz301302 TaxID=3342379 RepID=UPI0035BAB6DD
MLFRSATSRNIFSIAAAGVVTTIAAAGVLFSIAYKSTHDDALTQMRQIAGIHAAEIERGMAGGIDVARGLRSGLLALSGAASADRNAADALLKETLLDNPSTLGTWTVWEPDAFDRDDKSFAGKDGHDATGRYIPYWVRSGATVRREPLVDYEKPGAGDYYLLARNSGKTVVLEPYAYSIDGKDVMMTTISVPILRDGKPVAVTGIDISLAETNAQLSKIRPMGDGLVSLVTGSGHILSHPDAALLGKSLKDAGPGVAGWDGLIARPGTETRIIAPDGTPQIAIAYPIRLTDEIRWYALVFVPEATALAGVDRLAWSALLTTVVAALLLGLVGWMIARRFIGRIDNVIAETTRIAGGDLEVTLKDIDRRDEIGDLSRSLKTLLDSNRRRVELEQEANANRAAQLAQEAERARIASAQEQDVRDAVGELAAGLSRLAEGDMTVRLDRPFIAALDEIRANFNQSVEKLESAMLSFSENARTIHTGAEEIRSAADNLARRTEQQAASVEETAAALEEITTSVKDSAHRAEEAGALVARTKAGAEKSGTIVGDAVQAMSAIEQSSQSISNIIGVIDEIAFQTNLLALNAGVEAARAGEAGKGFAVVAQEVRELAQRSATAAKEIKSLIHSSSDQVKRGVTLVGETGAALQSIVREVQEIDANVTAIVQSAREQSTGLQEINAAVNQMDQATQQNAAMVEESNAASHTLATEVSALSARLGQFNLGRRSETARVAAARPARMGTTVAAVETRKPALRAVPSPARALGEKLTSAFGGAPAASGGGDWEEF